MPAKPRYPYPNPLYRSPYIVTAFCICLSSPRLGAHVFTFRQPPGGLEMKDFIIIIIIYLSPVPTHLSEWTTIHSCVLKLSSLESRLTNSAT